MVTWLLHDLGTSPTQYPSTYITNCHMTHYCHHSHVTWTWFTVPWFTLSCEPVWWSHDYWMTCALTHSIPLHISHDSHIWCTPLSPTQYPYTYHDSHIWCTPLCPQIHWREKHHSRSLWKLNTNILNLSNTSLTILTLTSASVIVYLFSLNIYLQATNVHVKLSLPSVWPAWAIGQIT